MNDLPPITPEGTWTQPAKHGRVLEYLTADNRRVQVRLWTFAEGSINGQPADLPCPMTDEEVPGLIMGALERTEAGKAEREKQKVEMGSGDGTLGTTSPTTGAATGDGALGTACPTIRRVLFLDVDGVLNTRVGSLDEDKLVWLQCLLLMTRAVLVVSSSWRTVPDQYERLVGTLARRGLHPVSCTPDLTIKKGDLHLSKDRWQEIEAWLQENPQVDQFVILDDLPWMGPLSQHHIKVNPEIGLTHNNVLDALVNFQRQAASKGDRGPWMPAQAGKEAA